jgi:hypothetical protein
VLGVAVVCAIAFAYIQPTRSYLEAKDDVTARRGDRSALLRQQGSLRKRLEAVDTEAFIVREARTSGLVRPGETLFVVKGIDRWKRIQADRP